MHNDVNTSIPLKLIHTTPGVLRFCYNILNSLCLCLSWNRLITGNKPSPCYFSHSKFNVSHDSRFSTHLSSSLNANLKILYSAFPLCKLTVIKASRRIIQNNQSINLNEQQNHVVDYVAWEVEWRRKSGGSAAGLEHHNIESLFVAGTLR